MSGHETRWYREDPNYRPQTPEDVELKRDVELLLRENWPDSDADRINSFVRALNSDPALPKKTDGASLLSATAAFIANQLRADSLQTPAYTTADFDRIMEREPGKNADVGKFTLWLMQNGYSSDIYTSADPFDDNLELLTQGKISMDEYVAAYRELSGPISDAYRQKLIDYTEQVIIPSRRMNKERFGSYEETGQITTKIVEQFPLEAVAEELDRGNVLYTEYPRTFVSDGISDTYYYPLAIFRPSIDMLAMVYNAASPDPSKRVQPYGCDWYMAHFLGASKVASIGHWRPESV